MSEPDPREELATLTAALRAHAELCVATGVHGLEAASAELMLARSAVQANLAPATTGVEAASPGPRAAAPSDTRNPAETSDPVGTIAHAARVVPGVSGARALAGPTPDATRRLELLGQEVSACRKCRLCEERTQTVFARGTGASGLCFVGEGPGADEDEQGFPFVGKAGQLLDRMIEAMGFSRDEVYVCNIVKCRPPKNRKPEADEMAACRPFLAEQLELLDPKVIVALGATALEGLLGITGGITRLRGTWRLYGGRVAVMPTFHPAYLLRAPEAKRDVWQDLQEVVKHLGRTVPLKK